MGDNDQQNQGNEQQPGAGTEPAAKGNGAGQQTSGGQSAQPGGQQTGDTQTQSQPAASQPKGVQVKLTPEQIAQIGKDGTLELTDNQFSGAVQGRIGQLTSRAKVAEGKLSEITAAQEEAERKALEEQQRFKDLYEKEREGRATDAATYKNSTIRSRFMVAALKANIVDPDAAFHIASALPGFKDVRVDDQGNVSGLDELVATLVKEKPFLISQQKPQSVGSASNPDKNEGDREPAKTIGEAGERVKAWMDKQA